jgi:3-oxoacyl-[acyl-carrier protein] reductase
MNVQEFAGLVAVVTGGASGIGLATARELASRGARVAVLDRNAEVPDPLVGFAADVTDRASVNAAIEAVAARFGGIDVLINNAGLGGLKTVVDMTDEEWSRVLDITLTGTMRMTRAVLKAMIPRKAGAIVNNASVLGWRAQKGQSHYAAAKAGVMAFTRCSALEAAEHGIRINAVSPSIAMHDFLKKASTEEELAQLSKVEAFGRAAEVWEVANVMMFLASDYAGYMVGEVVSVSSQRA